eukprot:CAMPEP_0198245222 /NCGR_PEP_ID=MMETSP1446-20131203/39861_1 /TAXON_ID=1461542 ORGANISM="Unidentified sp, Strain CCMP2111" /NCGR_SAMPLE_ID=MMETSP1446 /ASSEMBLY_ACC=CAM_ASM_001112 /LENGTH=40 /DNA_ID= /DNA_START= /DNA_END= /DNA_ORIENTATION=
MAEIPIRIPVACRCPPGCDPHLGFRLPGPDAADALVPGDP